MIRYKAYINKDWKECGQANVIAARMRNDGGIQWGTVLLDCWCLGVRDAVFVEDLAESDFQESLAIQLPDDLREAIHPACAKKLIEGAVEYAQRFGFAPHRDYKKVRRLFSGVESGACPDAFTYGKDGKPVFVAGEDDSIERITRILSMLEARCGMDGFEYILPDDDDELLDDEWVDEEEDDPLFTREELSGWLDREPQSVPRFYEVSGIITAMQLCPEVIMPTRLLEVLWGQKGRTWNDLESTSSFVNLILAYWNDVSDLIFECLTASHPEDKHPVDIWDADFENDGDAIAAHIHWAIGFKRATSIWEHAWGNALSRPDLTHEWAVITRWADFGNPNNKDAGGTFAESRSTLKLNHAVTGLARALRDPAA